MSNWGMLKAEVNGRLKYLNNGKFILSSHLISALLVLQITKYTPEKKRNKEDLKNWRLSKLGKMVFLSKKK
ncbi:MAG: hypothetical protein AB8B69_10885 [Chitinophagales bacterium]